MIVAGVDFGTLSVRVTLMDCDDGATLGGAVASYPLKRSAADPLLGTQSHDDQMDALARAMREAVARAGIRGEAVAALACDTTGSSVVMVDRDLRPLAVYYLWCDHRAHREAEEITAIGRAEGLEALKWCGGTYSHEWGYAKVLHFLRHNPDLRDRFATSQSGLLEQARQTSIDTSQAQRLGPRVLALHFALVSLRQRLRDLRL